MIRAARRDDGDYEIRSERGRFLVSRREINLRAVEVVVRNPMLRDKFTRRLENCRVFLSMREPAAKEIFDLSDEGYENMRHKAEAILETAPV